MSKAHTKRVTIQEINNSDIIKRFETKITKEYKLKKLSKTAVSHIYRAEIFLKCSPDVPITIQMWENGTILFQGSPKIDSSGFDAECDSIIQMVRDSLIITPDPKENPYKIRAGVLLDYINSLNKSNEVDRMVIVTMSDLVIELLLSSLIITSGFTQKESAEMLEKYLPLKISDLSKKGITIYRDDAMNQLHILRNRIAHATSIITEDEADWAFNLVKDIAENI